MSDNTNPSHQDPKSFAWHESFTKTLELLPDDKDKAKFALGLIRYGAYGTEPAFDYPMSGLFEAVRPNIDQSVKIRLRSKKANEARWGSDATEAESSK